MEKDPHCQCTVSSNTSLTFHKTNTKTLLMKFTSYVTTSGISQNGWMDDTDV